jgi:hypothetical protein
LFKETGIHQIYLSKMQIKTLKHAQKIVDVSCDISSGQFIPWPFRLSSIIPMSVPIEYGLVMLPQTTIITSAFLLLRQSYRSLVSFYHMNPACGYTEEDVGLGFLTGLTVSLGASLGSKNLLRAHVGRKLTQLMANGLSAFSAVALGNVADVLCLRNRDLINGIPVLDPETKEELGVSRRCARRAVLLSALSRIIYTSPMLVPPYLLSRIIVSGKTLPVWTAIEGFSFCSVSGINQYWVHPLLLTLHPKTHSIS